VLKHKATPLFIPSELGPLFAMYFTSSSRSNSQCIVHIPAFAEEMNKSRHMVSMQARAFADQGYSVLVFDLWGTGDSQGEFSEATLEIWLNNIESVISWLHDKGYQSIHLWGLRLGVLLAIEYVHKYDSYIDQLICWQPVLNGGQFVMQFLRLRVAAAMMDKNAPQEKTSDLKKQLMDGQSVEVAGYLLNPELMIPMLNIKVKNFSLNNIKRCYVFELTEGVELQANYATAQWAEEQEGKVVIDVINGSCFWATQEISESIELIDQSLLTVTE